MLPFPFIDEFDTAISALLSGNDRERLKVTDKLLDACIHDYNPEVPYGHGCSMGISVGSSSFYVVISMLPEGRRATRIRKAVHIGRVKTFDELDALISRYNVRSGLISPQPEPHLVAEWMRRGHGNIKTVVYMNDGMRKPEWDYPGRNVTVDRTYALNSAYEEIREGRWWLPRDAALIDGGEFYAQLKAPSRVRDLTTGELRYRWTETGALDHYRHAHAFDHLVGQSHCTPRVLII